mgnify:CR=1 FL=1
MTPKSNNAISFYNYLNRLDNKEEIGQVEDNNDLSYRDFDNVEELI